MVRQMQAEIAREREAHALSWQALEAKVSTQPSLCVLSDEGLTRNMCAMYCGLSGQCRARISCVLQRLRSVAAAGQDQGACGRRDGTVIVDDRYI